MARPLKKGLTYFPFDVDAFSSDEFRLIQAEFGNNGILVVLHIYCKIYKENGYYYKWGNDTRLLLSAGAGVVPNFITEVLEGCFRRSLFSKRVFQMFGVLTSHGIQLRYFEVAKKSRLSNIDIQEDFILLNDIEMASFNPIFKNIQSRISTHNTQPPELTTINPELITINSELTSIDPESTLQIKEKKSKSNNNNNNNTQEKDFLKKTEQTTQNNQPSVGDKELKKELLSPMWLEQVCVGLNVKMDEFRPFIQNYITMRAIRGDIQKYNISQHKLFAVTNFNKAKAEETKNQKQKTKKTSTEKETGTGNNQHTRPQLQRESALEHNKRIFNEIIGK